MTDAFDQSWRCQYTESFGSEGTDTSDPLLIRELDELAKVSCPGFMTDSRWKRLLSMAREARHLNAAYKTSQRNLASADKAIVQGQERVRSLNKQVVDHKASLYEALKVMHTLVAHLASFDAPHLSGPEAEAFTDFLAKHQQDEAPEEDHPR